MSRWCFVHCLYCIVQAVSSHIRRAQLYHHRHQYQKMTSYKAGHSTTTSNTVSIHPLFLCSKWHLVGDLSDCIIHPVHDLPMSRENPKREWVRVASSSSQPHTASVLLDWRSSSLLFWLSLQNPCPYMSRNIQGLNVSVRVSIHHKYLVIIPAWQGTYSAQTSHTE